MTWQELADDSGALIGIEADARDAGFTAVRFAFTRGVLCLEVDGDTDEVMPSVRDRDPTSPACPRRLRHLLGSGIESAWALTNHRGYVDGFQVRFSARKATVQFEAAASMLHMTSDLR